MTLPHSVMQRSSPIFRSVVRTRCALRRARAGLSLIELLIAIGVVLAVAAIVVPWTMGWLGTRELDNAEDNLTMQMMMARAAAREEGRPVEVVAQRDGASSTVNARWMLAREDGGDDEFERSGPRESDKSPSSINAPWARVRLPHGISVAGESAGRTGQGKSGGSGGGGGVEGGVPQTLAIFLPDGTVFFAPIFMLRTDAGSLRTMRVDHATGVPQQVERVRPDFEDTDSGETVPHSDDVDAIEGADEDAASNRVP